MQNERQMTVLSFQHSFTSSIREARHPFSSQTLT